MPESKRAPRRRRTATNDSLTAREEMMIEVFRQLTPHQQREEALRLLALVEANRVSRKLLQGRQLRAISNEEVRAAFKDVPPPGPKAKKKPKRDLGDAMGDYLDE